MQYDIKWTSGDSSGTDRVDGDGILEILDKFFTENRGKHVVSVAQVYEDPFLKQIIERENRKLRKKNESND